MFKLMILGSKLFIYDRFREDEKILLSGPCSEDTHMCTCVCVQKCEMLQLRDVLSLHSPQIHVYCTFKLSMKRQVQSLIAMEYFIL